MELVELKTIKNKLPESSFAYTHLDTSEHVFYHQGDLTLDILDLDEPYTAFKDLPPNNESHLNQEASTAIIINGNLTVKNIVSQDTDGGGVGLVVLGNLSADNIVVGGQEIYVTKNLSANQCFWGDYNHGTLCVNGTTTARVFVATDEYHYDEDKERITADFFLSDADEEKAEELFSEHIPYSIFDMSVLENKDQVLITSWRDWINREIVIDRLLNSQPILKQVITIVSKEEFEEARLPVIPRLFTHRSLTTLDDRKNAVPVFEKLLTLIPDNENTVSYTSKKYTTTVTLSRDITTTRASKKSSSIIFKTKNGVNISIKKQFYGLLGSLNKQHVLKITSVKDGVAKDVTEVFDIDDTLSQLTNNLWDELLTKTERGVYFKKCFEDVALPEDVLACLTLPFIQEQYNDYWDIDKNGFWYGDLTLSFRLHGARDYVGSLDIGVEIPSDDFDCRKYFLRPSALKNPTITVLSYCSSQEGRTVDRYNHIENLSEVLVFDWELYREAIHMYRAAKDALTEKNNEYLKEKDQERILKERVAARKLIREAVPYETAYIQGVNFKVINLHDANDCIGNLKDFNDNTIYHIFEDTDHFPDHGKRSVFLLAEDDVEMEHLHLVAEQKNYPDMYVLGFIFKKNLTLETYLLSETKEYPPSLIVLGTLEASTIRLADKIHYIANGITCDTLLGQLTTEIGDLYVRGPVTAWLIYADGMLLHFEKFTNVEAVISHDSPSISVLSQLKDVDGTTTSVENLFPSTHIVSDIVDDTFVTTTLYGNEDIADTYLKKMKHQDFTLIDHSKENLYTYTSFKEKIILELDTLTKILETSDSKSKGIDKVGVTSIIELFEEGGDSYRKILYTISGSKNMRMTLLNKKGTNILQLTLDYLDEHGDTQYRWQGDETTSGLEMKSVKCAMYKACKILQDDTNLKVPNNS